ncbi:c-type cytochrome [Methylosinus sporium]|uniref:c-type cytochrome n=1 Tax=Methylosinus sporium TaxID=428 RepID=UPI00383B3BAF
MVAALSCVELIDASARASEKAMAAERAETPTRDAARIAPDIDRLPDDSRGREVRMGRALIIETYKLIGPESRDPQSRFAGNNLSCQNCHLEAGAKPHGLSLVGVLSDYPRYAAREGAIETIQDRINDCLTRSLDGRPLPVDSKEMNAIVAYIAFLSTGVEKARRGAGQMAELTRPADPKEGAKAFVENCAACHGADGLGKRRGVVGDAEGYEFPPLWGSDSFNDGAGMGRLIAAANFIHANMPFGATYDHPALTIEQAWDIAAYMVSMDRPHKVDIDKDFPVGVEKFVDAGYGPYVDGLSPSQHKFGPFQPIRDKLEALKRSKSGGQANP